MVIFGVDLGNARTGLAVCDPGEVLASPVTQLECKGKSLSSIAELIAERAKKHGVAEIVVGYPKKMDGTSGASAVKCKDFAAKLEQICGLPVVLRDERLTTVMAHSALSAADVHGKKRKAVTDAAAAVIILQEYLDFRRNR
ncbi:MAG: Holliday junction resolvase RuvX [Oscillospiraceae bacterium]|jgi:putative Holliday junction resolvase|nr:Holliday junction resolvase RuvX [Oscillospiraceae bacterium]